jgi:hypothetical protein
LPFATAHQRDDAPRRAIGLFPRMKAEISLRRGRLI